MIVNITHDLGYGLTNYLLANGVYLYQKGSEWYADGHPDPQPLIDAYNPWPTEKEAKLAEIDDDFNKAVSTITAGWPPLEQQTWVKQEAEARLLQDDPNASTPMLSNIASMRGISTQELASRVLRDADVFTNAVAKYVGLRHKARQVVHDLPDVGEYDRLQELWNVKFGV